MKNIAMLFLFFCLHCQAQAKTVHQIDLMLFEQKKQSDRPSFDFPNLPSSQTINHATHPEASPIETSENAALFKRIESRGHFKSLWSGTWQQDKKPQMQIIHSGNVELWVVMQAKQARSMHLYLVKDKMMLTDQEFTIDYNQPVYFDHADYGAVIIISSKTIEDDQDQTDLLITQHDEEPQDS